MVQTKTLKLKNGQSFQVLVVMGMVKPLSFNDNKIYFETKDSRDVMDGQLYHRWSLGHGEYLTAWMVFKEDVISVQ